MSDPLASLAGQVDPDFFLMLVFACIAAPHTLNLGHHARISTVQPFILATIALFGTAEAVILAVASMTYFWVVSSPRMRLQKAAFNLGNLGLAAWLGGLAFYACGGRMGDVSSPPSLAALLLAVLVIFAVNTGLVSVVVGLEQNIPPFRVWYEKYSWTIGAQLAGGSLVVLLGTLRRYVGTEALFLCVPFCIMSYHFYKAYFQSASRESHRT
jgi:hypothetical protein